MNSHDDYGNNADPYRALFENLPDATAILDRKRRIISCNRAFCALLGYTPEDAIGKSIRIIFGSDENYNSFRDKISDAFNKENTFRTEWDFVRADGTLMPFETVVSAILDDKGAVTGYFAVARDIRERRLAEQTLRESEERYRAVIEDSDDGVALVKDSTHVYVNRKLLEMFGYESPPQIVGKPVSHLVHPDDHNHVLSHVEQKRKSDAAPTRYEFKGVRSNGTTIHIEAAVTTITHEGEKSILIRMRDVTERKRYEDALRASEERFRKCFELPLIGIAITSPAMRWIEVNDKLCSILGYTREELLHSTWADLTPSEELTEELSVYNRVLSGDLEGHTHEKHYIRKDGTIIDTNVSSLPVKKPDGSIDYFVALIEDITDRKRGEQALKEAEEKYRLLVEHATDLIFVIQDGVVKYPNPTTIEKTGYSKEELGRMPFIDLMHPDDRDMVLDRYQKRMMGNGVTAPCSYRSVTKDGRVCWGEASSVLIEWEGRPATLNFIRDITEQKKLEDQLLQAQKMEAIGTLAGGIAHDFNNLLMGIQGYTALMLHGLAPTHPHYVKLNRVLELVASGADLTQQLLGFARGGRYDLKPTDINRIIQKSSVLFGRTKKEISIRENLQEDLAMAEVDAGQIEQVLLNLMVNAWQAMPQGGNLYIETANVFLSARHVEQFGLTEGLYVRISVTDEGVGMDDKTKERIFEPFFTTKEMGRGTGLGLASAYGIIKGHKGTINVYSEIGHGTTFTIYLPASEKVSVKETIPSGDILIGSETILIVDDEEAIVTVTTEILEALGYRVLSARNGREAVDLYSARSAEINLVVLDMIMPDISGGEVFAFLKMINPHVKAILSSGYSLNEQASDIMEQGCRAFIQKPFTIQILSQKVREVLDQDS
jgi:two-component system cell cycle sensor histidine kinase/response regulator CckA